MFCVCHPKQGGAYGKQIEGNQNSKRSYDQTDIRAISD